MAALEMVVVKWATDKAAVVENLVAEEAVVKEAEVVGLDLHASDFSHTIKIHYKRKKKINSNTTHMKRDSSQDSVRTLQTLKQII